jgi:CxxC-x17-CxxC domain-containing protein
MRDYNGKKSSGAWKGGSKGGYKGKSAGSFGDSARRPRRDEGSKEMFEATCTQCNLACEVPFKPNGRKPVLCSICFRKENGGSATPSYFKPSYDRSSSFEKPAYRSTPHNDNEEVVRQLRALNDKMTQLIAAINELVVEEDEQN